MEMIDKILIITIVFLCIVCVVSDISSCGEWRVRCDEGTFTVSRHFLGCEPIYKESKTVWWLWPDETGRKLIICHNCKIIEEYLEKGKKDESNN